jgi:perosamine synthetase
METTIKALPFGRPVIGEEERAAVLEVLSGPVLVHGPRTTQFEADFAAYSGAPHAVSVSSCTAGMHLVWFALGLGAGDEVIVPAMTHVATAHAVELTGARAVFVDAEPRTGNIDIDQIVGAVTTRTRGIAIVHYLGLPVDMLGLVEFAHRRGLFLMEDCALAVGSTIAGKHAGLLGDCGVFSFYPVKHITTAEGGMIILKDADLAAKLRLKKAFGVDRSHGERKTPGVYDVVDLGLNYRMSEIHAAIGIEQLKKATSFLRRRAENYHVLSNELAGLSGISLFASSNSVLVSSYYCLPVLLAPRLAAQRPEIMGALGRRGVGTSVYYSQPVPRMSYYANKYGWQAGSFPHAERIADSSIALPVGPHLSPDDMTYIAQSVRAVLEEFES